MVNLGITFGGNVTALDLTVLAPMVEKDFNSLWVSESWGRDAFIELATAALSSSTLQLGTAIVNIYSRTSAQLAMAAATLDELSKGRALLGLGVGAEALIRDWHSMQFDSPLGRMAETIEAVRLILTGERVDLQRKRIRMQRFRLGFQPLRKTIPIYLAALGPKMLRLAGEKADGVFLYFTPITHIKTSLQEIEKGLKVSGTERDFQKALYVPTIISSDGETARNSARRLVAYYICSMGPYYAEHLKRLGLGRTVDRIKELWKSGNREEARQEIPDHLVEGMTIAGSTNECRELLHKYMEAGLDTIIMAVDIPAEVEAKRITEDVLEMVNS